MASKRKVALLFGPPGVGKGTQGKLLGGIPGFRHLATGDIFRSLDKASELGRTFLEYSTKGELVPDDVTIAVFRDHLEKLQAAGEYDPEVHLLLLDGIPRSVKQAEILNDDLEVLAMVHLVAPDEEELIRRLQRRASKENRPDDAEEEVVRNRLAVYRNETYPVLHHFGDERVTEVNAIGSPGRVLRDVLNALAPIQESQFANALER